MSDTAPVIVTALMGAQDFAWADALRRAHFPPERNHIPAHITLFHHLPPSALAEVAQRLRGLCAGPPPPARLTEVMMLGRGVAYRVESPDLLAMRQELAEAFSGLLTPQDQGRPRFHITVQNKVSPEEAKALAAVLCATFKPRPLAIAGLAAWHYRGGPWDLAMKVMFRG
ncbi:hypothetical protein SAMIE_1004420 [Sphingobium amiense]|uniref:2'-5' RNA ligase family protein n=1 Tax=Sphingobium amiense TaxID=135719 RepID=A0A494VYK0_9SPHN|nr:2'-5' RNA ligase family protein [Sphingobium amiense]BBD96941.1 hypothetical protein SAMIE_1004420 [Sphingobium amiense]